MGKPENAELARRITYWRRTAGYRKIGFARRLGVDPSAVTRWEDGTAAPTAGYRSAIAILCGTDVQTLMFGDIPDEFPDDPDESPESLATVLDDDDDPREAANG